METKVLAGDTLDWDEFVGRCPRACIYHDSRWRAVFEHTFSHKAYYLAAYDAGQISGVLPLIEIKSLVFGHSLVSLPFVTYAGMAAEPEAERPLAEAARRLARSIGAQRLEVRQTGTADIGWSARRHKVGLVVDLPEDLTQYWSALSSRLRGKARKAWREGAAFQIQDREGLRLFYEVFGRNMRDLGTPVYPYQFFDNILTVFPAEARVLLVTKRGVPAAAAIGIQDRSTLQLPWICSNYDFSHSYVNEFLYWSILEWAHKSGFRAVDFGRSTVGNGNHRFKLQWQPQEVPLHWYTWTADGQPAPELRPDNPKYSLAIRCWRQLPVAMANLLGPAIVRNIP